MHLIYEALKKTNGDTDGEKLIGAMKGMKWESPRGPISIDPETRDIVQNIYMRKVEKVNGELYNVEFATFEAVKDPMKKKAQVHDHRTAGRRHPSGAEGTGARAECALQGDHGRLRAPPARLRARGEADRGGIPRPR